MNCRTLNTIILTCLAFASTVSAQDLPHHGEGQSAASAIPAIVFIPTPHDVVSEMLKLAAIGAEDVVYDLGCGDGRIVIAAAKTYGCRAVGFDIDPIRIRESQEHVARNQLKSHVLIERRDVLKVDLRPATVVTLYLHPRLNARLVPQFRKMKAGARVLSHQFGIPGVKPDKVIHVTSEEDQRVHTLFLWTTPLGADSDSPRTECPE